MNYDVRISLSTHLNRLHSILFLIPGTIKAFVYWTGEYPLFPLGLQQTLVNCFSNPLSICKMNNTVVINLITVSVQALDRKSVV